MAMAPDAKSADPFASLENLFCLVFFGRETTPTHAEESRDAEGEEEENGGGDAAGTRRRGKKDD